MEGRGGRRVTCIGAVAIKWQAIKSYSCIDRSSHAFALCQHAMLPGDGMEQQPSSVADGRADGCARYVETLTTNEYRESVLYYNNNISSQCFVLRSSCCQQVLSTTNSNNRQACCQTKCAASNYSPSKRLSAMHDTCSCRRELSRIFFTVHSGNSPYF